jgi:hypothetical protein
LIAKELGLIDWDMKRIYKWATQMLLALREDVQPPATDLATIIGDYLNRHMQNILVVNDKVDRRTQMPMLPQLEPKGELLVRYEPDTNRMYIAAKHFKSDCVDTQINYKETLGRAKEAGHLPQARGEAAVEGYEGYHSGSLLAGVRHVRGWLPQPR